MRRIVVFLTLAALGACQVPPADKPAAAPAPAPAASPEVAGDTCGAVAAQAHIGKPKGEYPVPADTETFRMLCTTCPMTMDFRPDRLSVFFDEKTGKVTAARCG